MEQAIRNFNKQFAWEPVIENEDTLLKARKFVVGGMGGSNLATELLKIVRPELDIIVHRDYGIPSLFNKARIVTRGNLAQRGGASRAIRLQADMRVPKSELSEHPLWIASSYSGNTEETLDFAKQAVKKGYHVAAISIGGQLIEFAAKKELPHLIIPDTKIQPRSALGFALVGLAAFLRDRALLSELHTLASALQPSAFEQRGKALAAALRGRVLVVYSSARNHAIAYNWKIKFNETGKIPAFSNVFPELNHNEMTGFDVIPTTKALSNRLHFIFLTDGFDHPQVQKRMNVCRKLYEGRGLSVTEAPLQGRTALQKIFSSLLVADWTALHLSRFYGTEAQHVPMVEEFKRLITVTGN